MTPRAGVYEIKRTETGDRYIGSAADLKRRRIEHWRDLRGDYHINHHLQNAWNKYGEKAFEFNVFLYCDPEMMLVFEQRAIDQSGHYNLSPTAGNNLGMKHTKEAKANMSVAQMGNQNALGCTRSDETKARLSAAAMGRKTSEEVRAKQSAGMKGKQKWWLGRKHTEESKAKMSASRMGRKRTEETKANMSAGMKLSCARRRAEAVSRQG